MIQIGTGPAAVKIYTITRADGYAEHTLAWKEGGRRRKRSISCPDEAQVVAQQITVRLTNGIATGDEVTRRDLDHHFQEKQSLDSHGFCGGLSSSAP